MLATKIVFLSVQVKVYVPVFFCNLVVMGLILKEFDEFYFIYDAVSSPRLKLQNFNFVFLHRNFEALECSKLFEKMQLGLSNYRQNFQNCCDLRLFSFKFFLWKFLTYSEKFPNHTTISMVQNFQAKKKSMRMKQPFDTILRK